MTEEAARKGVGRAEKAEARRAAREASAGENAARRGTREA